jgi:TonB-linked SusC/RagA family outer membrane protein
MTCHWYMKRKITNLGVKMKGSLIFSNWSSKACIAVLLLLLFPYHLYSQQKDFSFNLRNIKVIDVFKLIETQSNYIIICNEDFVDVNRRLNIQVKGQPIEVVLDKLFKGTNNIYSIHNRQIVITAAKKNESLSSNPIENSTSVIEGIVKDENDMPLIGVTVFEIGEENGTITDRNGKFRITLRGSANSLAFSSIGMKRKEVAVQGQSIIEVLMMEENYTMEELVVVGYGSQKKISITGSISTIDINELIKSPTSSVQNALAGRLSGLTIIQKSGAPGSDFADIFIRGRSTYGDASPLIIVDGVERDIATIDHHEIESINILKDAAATAVYGVRGANGIIVLTTKSGSTSSKPNVIFTANYGFSNPTRIPRFLNSGEYARMTNMASLNDVRTYEQPNGPLSFTYPFSEDDIALYESGKDPIFHPNTDWMNTLIHKNAPQQKYNINISGGTEKVVYFASLGYFNQVGNFGGLQVFKDMPVNSNINRNNIRLNTDFYWTNNFTTSLKFATQFTKGYNTDILAGSADILHHIFSLNPLINAPMIDGKVINEASELAGYVISGNPIRSINRRYSLQYQSLTTLDVSSELKLDVLLEGLSFKTKFAYDNYYQQLSVRSRMTNGYDLIRTSPSTFGDNYRLVQTTFESPFSINQTYNYNYRIYSEASLDYNQIFNNSHSIGALFLGTAERSYRGGNPALPYNYVGLVGRVTYNYNRKYLTEFNIGYNGSENFALGRQFGFFPAYSFGYILSEEDFFPKNSIVSFLKLRGSYGKVGNDKLGDSRFMYTDNSYVLVEPGNATIRFGEANIKPVAFYKESKIGNSILTWEVSTKTNIGFDLKLFDNKLSIGADIFKESRNNILDSYKNVPFTFGDLSLLPNYNLGQVENGGMEFEIDYRNSTPKLLQFWVNGNFSFARNKIVFNDEIPPEHSNLIRTGKPINQPFMYIANGFYNTWDEVNDPDRVKTKWDQNVQPGDLRFVDISGDGYVDENDLIAVGFGTLPEITFGLSLGMKWRAFDFSLLLQGSANVSNYYGSPIFMKIEWSARTEADYDAWTEEKFLNGDKILFPRLSNGKLNANSQMNSYLNQDASFIRVKNVEFGYSINKAFANSLGFESLRFFFNAQNLLTFTKMKYWDPESLRGTDRQYPVTRITNLGIRAIL